MTRSWWPILIVLLSMLTLWVLAVAPMNFRQALDQAERQNELVIPEGFGARQETGLVSLLINNASHISKAFHMERPRLPTPAQVSEEIWNTTGAMAIKGRAWSKRSLIYHAWITLKSTFYGFGLGLTLGLIGAISVVYYRVADLTLMPWAIISQTIPIVALAPMIIVVSGQMGIENRDIPKAVISAYLCFFPIMVGMVKGLRSADPIQLDLMKTYNATGRDIFFKLRLPASMPYLFPSLKVGIAAALVGTIVGELPTGAISGLGARILIGDQFGAPMAIWAALAVAAVLAGILVTLIDFIQSLTLRRMGMVQ